MLFIICASQGATANLRTWDSTNETENQFISIDTQKQMSTALYIHISVKVLYICNIQPQARILLQICRETAEHEYNYLTITIIYICIYTYIIYNIYIYIYID